MKDNKSCLPAHIACMRHCSPEKLRMLLAVNPAALHAPNDENKTLLDLAKSKATQAHPNYALIDELEKQLAGDTSHYDPVVFNTPLRQPPLSRSRIQYYNEMNNSAVSKPAIVSISHHSNHQAYSAVYPPFTNTPSPAGRDYHYQYPYSQQPYQRHFFPHPAGAYHLHPNHYEDHSHLSNVGRVSSEDDDGDAWNRPRLDSNGTWTSPIRQHQSPLPYFPQPHQYRQEDIRNNGTMAFDHTPLDIDPVNLYGATSPNYTPPSIHVHAPYDSNSVALPQKTRIMYDTPTPSWQRKQKSFSSQASNTCEEPAAKLLLDFSRNLNSSADDNITNHVDDHVDSNIDASHEGECNRYARAFPAHHDRHSIALREIVKANPTSLDLTTASGITEV